MISMPRMLAVGLGLVLGVATGCGPTEPAERTVDDTGIAYRLARINDVPLPAFFGSSQPRTFYSGEICLFNTGQYRLSTTTDGGTGPNSRSTAESYGAYSLTTTPKTFQGAAQVLMTAAADSMVLHYTSSPEDWLYVLDATRKSTACLLQPAP